MKKIYITGVAGLLGSNLIYILRDKYKICGSDLIPVKCDGLSMDCIDLLNYNELQKSIARHKPDVIVHTAALVNVDACEENQELAYKINDDLTRKISEIGQENNIKIIYISTDAVFDGESTKLYTENDIPNPINIYAQTKLAGEKHILRNEMNTVLRTNIYGYNVQDKDSFGEWILNSLKENKEINMFNDISISPILVNDLASIIDAVINNDLVGLYHACSSGSISKYDFGCILKSKFLLEQGVIHRTNSDIMTFKAKRSKNMGLSNKKICSELGITIRTPEESISYFKELYDQKYPQTLKSKVQL